MKEKLRIPFSFEAQIREQCDLPRAKRWHAQFKCYPLGYFRGEGRCPGTALAQAWKKFREEVDPGERWWIVGTGAPLCRF